MSDSITLAPAKPALHENGNLASYACHAHKTRGRLVDENECAERSAFRRDCDRIVHSTAFRRLEYKTQVFINHEGDHYRTRLTHSLEVAQIARSIARILKLDEDLAETLALAHDLGHTPFGHAGEDALNEVSKAYGGFSHNEQSFRILTQLEHKYAEFNGLNLTWETLEGVMKHNGPIIGKFMDKKRYDGTVPETVAAHNEKQDLELDSFASAEAQAAAFADDIAYNNHDIDDGLRAGLFSVDDLCDLPVIGSIITDVRQTYPTVEEPRLVHEVIRRMISIMVGDVINTTLENIKTYQIETVEDIRGLGKPLVHFSAEMDANQKQIKAFLMDNMYRHYKVCRMTSKARRIVADLYGIFTEEPECLPTLWRDAVKRSTNEKEKSRIISDFIAGMTDRFAVKEHQRLFDLTYQNQ